MRSANFPDLKTILYSKSLNSFLYLVDKQLYLLDMNCCDVKSVKSRSSKNSNQNDLCKVIQVSDMKFITMSVDNCLKHLEFNIEKKTKKENVKGFLCPYCLRIFFSHRALYVEHMNEHKGPVKCESCEV